jgi:riboflavin kinase/FMN adenylyltransferase
VTIWRDFPGAAADARQEPAVVTIGNFDGVHRGHQALLARARELGRPVVAVSFDPHPARVFAPDRAPHLLCSLARRVELLGEHGADEVRLLAFDREMASWSPEEFIDRVLMRELRRPLSSSARTSGSVHAPPGTSPCCASWGSAPDSSPRVSA